MKMLAVRRDERFGSLDECLERALFIEGVDQFHRRDAMLRFDDAPADA
jgi:hypothetical protein